MEYRESYDSPLGRIMMVSDGLALTGVWFNENENQNGSVCERVFEETRLWLDEYFDGRKPDFTPPLSLRGTQFQERVWKELLTISYGTTVSYGELAKRLGVRSAQAVGGAVGRNPIAIIVPCHRVIGADGKLVGYAYGVERKQKLLKLEIAR